MLFNGPQAGPLELFKLDVDPRRDDETSPMRRFEEWRLNGTNLYNINVHEVNTDYVETYLNVYG